MDLDDDGGVVCACVKIEEEGDGLGGGRRGKFPENCIKNREYNTMSRLLLAILGGN